MHSFRRIPASTIPAYIGTLLSGLLFLSAAYGTEPATPLAQASGEIYVRVVEPSAPADGEVVAGSRNTPSSFVAAEPVRFALPEYPRMARTASQEGLVRACFTIDEQGRVVEPSVRSSSAAVFDRAVLAALTNSRFNPALADGKPVRSTVCKTWRFVLDGRSLPQ